MSAKLVVDIVAIVLIFGGLFFFVAGTIGLLRLPDFFSRIHAVGKCDTLGAMLMLGGLALHVFGAHEWARDSLLADSLIALKLLAIVVFIFVANPTATHAFSRAALRSGLQPYTLGEPKPVSDTPRWVERPAPEGPGEDA